MKTLLNYILCSFVLQGRMSPESLKWEGTVVRFLVNTEGCGYPPFINCSLFALKYGHVNLEEINELLKINQSETRELYRHGNSTTETDDQEEPSLMLENDFTTLSATTVEDDFQVAALSTLIDQQNSEVAEEAMPFKVFPCYYSRAYPDRVVADYDWHHTIKTLVAAVVIPWTLFFVSCAVLCYWYCPTLKKEFMIDFDKRKTAAVKNENPQLVIR